MKPIIVVLGILGLFSNALGAETVLQTEDQSMIESAADLTPSEVGVLLVNPNDPHRAKVVAVINKSNQGSTAQVMKVYVDGIALLDSFGTEDWKISSGREKREKAKNGDVYNTTTPVGYFRPQRLELLHESKKWKAEMPHAVFFYGGIATHATTHIHDLGKRASGGCVRLHPKNAKKFYDLIHAMGIAEVTLVSRNGSDVLKKDGTPVKVQAYDVLIIVENRI